MANDYLFLRCRACRKGFMFMKYSPGCGSIVGEHRLGRLIEKHIRCSHDFDMDLEGDRCFDIIAQSADSFPWVHQFRPESEYGEPFTEEDATPSLSPTWKRLSKHYRSLLEQAHEEIVSLSTALARARRVGSMPPLQ